MAGSDILLTFNAGSSTLKIGIFLVKTGEAQSIGRGKVDFSAARPMLTWAIGDHQGSEQLSGTGDDRFSVAVEETITHVHETLPGRLIAIGHRVVHGGMLFREATRLDETTIRSIASLIPLAPLHQPAALKAIRAVERLHPGLPQSASFDTAFHAEQDALASRLAIPRELHEQGVRRYGFHGLSYQYVWRRLRQIAPQVADGKLVIAHLGSGASLCAIENGKSRDTSMGFSALDGIPMATRPGALDAGAVLHLLRNGYGEPDDLEDFLYHHCGLAGVSGLSADTRVLLKDNGEKAREAIDLFCMRIAGETARLASTIGGLDTFVFTAGIGEHQPEIRSRIIERLGWLGASLDDAANCEGQTKISDRLSRINVFVVPTDEEQVIADETIRLII